MKQTKDERAALQLAQVHAAAPIVGLTVWNGGALHNGYGKTGIVFANGEAARKAVESLGYKITHQGEGFAEYDPPSAPEACRSLESLMSEAYHLSLSLAYATIAPGGSYFDPRELPETPVCDKVWSWADDLMARCYEKHATGHCSLSALISFDLAEWEAEVIADIAAFKALLAEVGEPVQLTCADLAARDYRGSGAGYTPEQDRLYYLDRARKGLVEAHAEPEDTYDNWHHKRESIRYYTAEIAKLESEAPASTAA